MSGRNKLIKANPAVIRRRSEPALQESFNTAQIADDDTSTVNANTVAHTSILQRKALKPKRRVKSSVLENIRNASSRLLSSSNENRDAPAKEAISQQAASLINLVKPTPAIPPRRIRPALPLADRENIPEVLDSRARGVDTLTTKSKSRPLKRTTSVILEHSQAENRLFPAPTRETIKPPSAHEQEFTFVRPKSNPASAVLTRQSGVENIWTDIIDDEEIRDVPDLEMRDVDVVPVVRPVQKSPPKDLSAEVEHIRQRLKEAFDDFDTADSATDFTTDFTTDCDDLSENELDGFNVRLLMRNYVEIWGPQDLLERPNAIIEVMLEITRDSPEHGLAYPLQDLQVDVKMFTLGSRARHAWTSSRSADTPTMRPRLTTSMHDAFISLNAGRREPDFWVSSKSKNVDIDSLRLQLTTPADDPDAITLLPGWSFSYTGAGFVKKMNIPIPRRLFWKEETRQFGIIAEVRLSRGLPGLGGDGLLVASKVFAASHFTDTVLPEMRKKW